MPRKPRHRALATLPPPVDALTGTSLTDRNERLCEEAGFGRAQKVKDLRALLEVLRSKLTARRTVRLVRREGRDHDVIEEFEDVAHDVQLRAVSQYIDLLGVSAPKQAPAVGAGNVTISVRLAPLPGELPAMLDDQRSRLAPLPGERPAKPAGSLIIEHNPA